MAEKRKSVSYRLWPDLVEQVQQVAEIKRRSVTWVVERALEEYVERTLREERSKLAA